MENTNIISTHTVSKATTPTVSKAKKEEVSWSVDPEEVPVLAAKAGLKATTPTVSKAKKEEVSWSVDPEEVPVLAANAGLKLGKHGLEKVKDGTVPVRASELGLQAPGDPCDPFFYVTRSQADGDGIVAEDQFKETEYKNDDKEENKK